MNSEKLAAVSIVAVVALIIGLIVLSSSVYIIEPGNRGVLVTLGKADPNYRPEGMGFKAPFMSKLINIPIRQQSVEFDAACFSSDLQTVNIRTRVLYRFQENNVVKLYTDYPVNVFETIIKPKTHEALKEVTALRTAENIVKDREGVKKMAKEFLLQKIDNLILIDDVVLENIDLSKELEHAIEKKMVQEQEAGRAKFAQQQATIEAETARIRAKGEADAIRMRSDALDKNPKIIELQIVEKWNGVTPLVVGGGDGANILLPLSDRSSKSSK